MKKIEFSTTIECLESYLDLEDSDEVRLCEATFKALEHSYAPYSEYRVGAAVLLDNGQLVEGSNQENAVFPLGLCAERVAIFSANTSYPKSKIRTVAVITAKEVSENELPGFPCGSCRQVMIDMEDRHNRSIRILILAPDGRTYIVQSAKDLLPFAFADKDLR